MLILVISSDRSTECVFIATSNTTGWPTMRVAGFTSTVTLPPAFDWVSNAAPFDLDADDAARLLTAGLVAVGAFVDTGAAVGVGAPAHATSSSVASTSIVM